MTSILSHAIRRSMSNRFMSELGIARLSTYQTDLARGDKIHMLVLEDRWLTPTVRSFTACVLNVEPCWCGRRVKVAHVHGDQIEELDLPDTAAEEGVIACRILERHAYTEFLFAEAAEARTTPRTT